MDEEGRKKLIREIVVLFAGSAVFLYVFSLGSDYLYIPLVIGMTCFELIITVQTYRISILIAWTILLQIVWAITFLLMPVAVWWTYPPAGSPFHRYYD